MNTLLHWLTSPEWALVVKALLHSLWQAALIAIALALVLRRVANPAARYRLALGGLGAVLLSAMLTWGVLNAATPPAAAITPAPVATTAMPAAPTGPVQKIVVAANWTAAKPKMQWTAWLALVWLIGTGVMLGRASVKVAGAEQLRRSCQPLNDDRVIALVAEARRAVKLTRQIRVVVTQQLTSPAVVGVLMPTLILPLSLITTLSLEQIRFILLHELAHIRRGDYLANLFQLFAEALLFFNPAVWWLSHQIRREREACCDALAIELSGAPADYARTLVSVAETMLQPAPAAAPAFGNDREPSSLSDRVHRVLVPGYRPSLRLTWRAMLAALVLGGVLLGLLAAGTRETVAATGALLTPSGKPASPSLTPTTNPQSITATPLSLDPGPNPKVVSYFSFFQEPIIVGADGKYEWGGVKMDLTQLREQLAAFKEADSQAKVQLNIDTNAPFKTISALMEALRELDIWARGQTTNPPTASSTNLVTRTFKITALELARAVGDVGPLTLTNTAANLQQFLAQAGFDRQLPGRSLFFSDAGGLFVRGTVDEIARVERAVTENPANSPVSSFARPAAAETSEAEVSTQSTADAEWITVLPMSLEPGAGITRYTHIDVLTVEVLKDGDYKYQSAKLDLAGLRARLLEWTNSVLNSQFAVLVLTNAPAQSVSNVVKLIAGFGATAIIEQVQPPTSIFVPTSELLKEEANATSASPRQKTATRQPAQSSNPADTNLHTRTFKVDPNTFVMGMESAGGLKTTNVTKDVRDFFATIGVDLQPPKTMFFNERQGGLFVRALLADFDIIEQALQVLNQVAPQVNIRAKFVEVPSGTSVYLGNLSLPKGLPGSASGRTAEMTSASSNGITGILTAPQFEAVIKALEANPHATVLTAPEVTTLSGRQAQLQMVDIKTVVTGTVSLVTNGVTTNVFQTSALPFGPTLDVIPYVAADGFTIQLTLIPTVTEFLGYDKPAAALTNFAREKSLDTSLPLPHFRVRQATTTANVWDGQTIVIGGFTSEIVTRQPDGSETKRPAPAAGSKQLFVFITPTIIDPAGNRVNTPADGIHEP